MHVDKEDGGTLLLILISLDCVPYKPYCVHSRLNETSSHLIVLGVPAQDLEHLCGLKVGEVGSLSARRDEHHLAVPMTAGW